MYIDNLETNSSIRKIKRREGGREGRRKEVNKKIYFSHLSQTVKSYVKLIFLSLKFRNSSYKSGILNLSLLFFAFLWDSLWESSLCKSSFDFDCLSHSLSFSLAWIVSPLTLDNCALACAIATSTSIAYLIVLALDVSIGFNCSRA